MNEALCLERKYCRNNRIGRRSGQRRSVAGLAPFSINPIRFSSGRGGGDGGGGGGAAGGDGSRSYPLCTPRLGDGGAKSDQQA
jgi:hypothetical protein